MRELLYLCHRLPFPPDRGDRTRSFHLLSALARAHRVHLLAFDDVGRRPEEWAPLHDLCASVEVVPLPARRAYLRTAIWSWHPRPLTLSYFHSRLLRRRVHELGARRPLDGIVAFSTAMGPYALALPGIPRVLDMVDVDSGKWAQYARRGPLPMRPVYALETRRVRAYEKAITPLFERVVLATERERALLTSFAMGGTVVTIRNGVRLPAEAPTVGTDPQPTLLFAGQMDYLPNVDAVTVLARKVLPVLRRRFGDVRLLVVGRCPCPTVRALAALPGVTVTGEVPEVGPFYRRAWLFVAPIQIAQGVQNKVMEAMAAGVPVVTSSAVARGLVDGEVAPGRDFVVADGEDAVARAVARLLDSPGERATLADNARARMAAAYSWERSGVELVRLVDGVCEGRGRGHAPRPARAPDELLARA